MKKICIFLLALFTISTISSACTMQPNASMVKSERRFAKYIEPSKNNTGGMVDLSEGPRLKYDAYLGPQKLNFDFKIINPY